MTPFLRKLRLLSGLMIAVFVLSHLANLSLGLLSLEAMEHYRKLHSLVWQSWPGTFLLYGALVAHMLLAVYSLFRRHHFRLQSWDAIQLVLGFGVPVLLLEHILETRVTSLLLEFDITYPYLLTFIWLDFGHLIRQTILLLVVWAHLLVGLYFWCRPKSWFGRYAVYLKLAAAAVPALAWAGLASAGIAVERLSVMPSWIAGIRENWNAAPPELIALIEERYVIGLLSFASLIGLTLIVRTIARRFGARHGRVIITYPSNRKVSVPIGYSILEASRVHDIPHASVCGGRGRCTTCRVRLLHGTHRLLDSPGALEAAALKRLDAPIDVRLACQVRPRSAISVLPLLSAVGEKSGSGRNGGLSGEERELAILFVDIRGSSRLCEEHLPFDVVYILNQFFAEMTEAVDKTRGHYAQFNGDGLMALYGLDTNLEEGCRDALAGAVEIQCRIDELNRVLKHELKHELEVGIGIHCGEVIVGKMGPPKTPIVSAIGTNVNIAARLETLTKQFDCGIAVSADVLNHAGQATKPFEFHRMSLDGLRDSISVFTLPKGFSGDFLNAGAANSDVGE